MKGEFEKEKKTTFKLLTQTLKMSSGHNPTKLAYTIIYF
jgi:hypothetical protein